MTHRQQSYVVAAICIMIALFFFVCSLSVRTDGSYPRVLCISLMILAVIDILQTRSEGRKEALLPHMELDKAQMTTEELAEQLAKGAKEAVPWQDLVAVIATSFGSLLLWKPISFVFAGMVPILLLSLYKKQPGLKSLLLAVCTVVVLQLIFRNIFTIPIPSPSWWPRF